ncbi:unnamed protein product [Callosobruchus maculatus]|uniref:SH3 domain-containing protein n=1 Tax=Callosobruchus maculatus TaxID=64391 RepID=A0A653DGF3_CALMS|nr:unnamed protein product [Callosobruchus maculatus]
MDTEECCKALMVKALYSYKRINNDELTFKKGDIITVSQKGNLDGWWEGILNGEKGWFPSNYVKEITSQQNQYKSIVLKDLVDSEKFYVEELENLISNYLQPLKKTRILTEDQYKQLTSNIKEIVELHQHLLDLVEAELKKHGKQQRLGRLFLQWAPKIQKAHQFYCSLHPRAVCILDIFRRSMPWYPSINNHVEQAFQTTR